MLDQAERARLLRLARASVEAAARGESFSPDEPPTGALAQPSGVFVTLKTKDGRLRGCIGLIEPGPPLQQAVVEMARSAALHDPRFPPVTPAEVDDLRIEISVLSPPQPLDNVEHIVVGQHGLIVERGPYRGLLLPQVAPEWGWDRDEFLAHTCMKAGLPPDAWRDEKTRIYTFTAEVFGEEE